MNDVFLDTANAWKALDDQIDELEQKRSAIEHQIKELKKQIQPYEEQLLQMFAENGVNNIKIHGKTIYIHRQLWARPVDGDYERACKILREIGLDEYVKETVNVNNISAYVREQDEMGSELPSSFYDAFRVDEVYKVRSRLSDKGK